jgi:hypothetical protein
MIMVSGACTLISSVAAIAKFAGGAWLPALGFTAVTLFFAFAAYSWFRRFRNPPALATFTPLGVTNEYGQTFEWSQILRVYKFTGVLFLKDHSKAGWVVRLDPAEVGGVQMAKAIEFIKYHAPRHLTERL